VESTKVSCGWTEGRERDYGRGRERKKTERRKERKVYSKVVRKWLDKRGVFVGGGGISCAQEVFPRRIGETAYAMRISFCLKKEKQKKE